MTVARHVGGEDADLAVRDLASRTSVLSRHPARRLALLEKAGLVDHQDRVVIRQMLDDIIADDIAQAIRIPIPAPQDRLLPPRARIASCLRAHPTGFALLISEQTFQKQASIRRNTILIEQRTYPFLDLTERRRPQRKRLFNRRWPRPRSSNHGCPWIQKPAEKATVVLGADYHLPLAELMSAHLKPAHIAGLAPSLHQREEGVRPGAIKVVEQALAFPGAAFTIV